MRDFSQTVNLSPLRYPGSKKRLSVYISQIIKYNRLNIDVFVEPFVGGGNVALYLLINGLAKRIIIADKDQLIYSFWLTLFRNPNYLINFIKKVKVNLENFYRYKKIVNSTNKFEERKLAEACLFLNRTSFSGLLTNSAGPLGGKKQKSKYKIDCRFNKKYLIKKIEYLASFHSQVIVLPHDWRDTVRYTENLVKRQKNLQDTLFYFDPPFYHKAEHLYRLYFKKQDHEDLRKVVLSLKHPWILSYDNAPEIKKMYSKFKRIHVQMPYFINSSARRIEKELIITPLRLSRIR